MPTIFTHAVAAAAMSYTVPTPATARHRWLTLAAAASAVVPDADVLAFDLGIPYGHVLGHRGFSHSLLFAAAWAAVVARLVASADGRWRAWSVIACATASHGVLDAMTNGGLGVGFWTPMRAERYFLPWRPIAVSPIGGGFLTARALDGSYRWVGVVTSELLWVWLPAAVLVGTVAAARRRRRGTA